MGHVPTLLIMLMMLLRYEGFANSQGTTSAEQATSFLPSHCPKKCGNITIEYPFGIGDGCFPSGRNLTCKYISADSSTKLFLGDSTIEVKQFDIEQGEMTVEKYKSSSMIDIKVTNFRLTSEKMCATKCGDNDVPYPFGLEEGCYRNEFFHLECNESAKPHYLIYEYEKVDSISLADGKLETTTQQRIVDNGDDMDPFDYEESPQIYSYLSRRKQIYSWVIARQSCKDAQVINRTAFACIAKSSDCIEDKNTSHIIGYRCKCSEGFTGNPYIVGGCKDINECDDANRYTCYGICSNTEGNYNCTCPRGSSGDPKQKPCIPDPKMSALLLGIIIGTSNGMGLLLLCAIFYILKRKYKKRHQERMRKKYFHQNHGLLLKQLISSGEDITERTRIFSLEEVKKATNNFDRTRILGRGGHGTFFKGILSDQRVVAIKKSKITKRSEIDQFINEVAILSQINHRHIVKLFGCCLETEVPLLIYEFISNGVLSDHLYITNGNSVLSWEDRLRIATEAAGALAYLHSAASISILHRDVKSSNILFDDQFTAKVSDFGASI